MKIEKKITASTKVRKELCKLFGVTNAMISKALTFTDVREGSDLAKKIRRAAIVKGGEVMNWVPECETIHCADGFMRQSFENGATIVVTMADGKATVYDKNGVRRQQVEKGCMVSQLEGLQAYAQSL